MADIIIGYSACPLTRSAFEAHGHTVYTCDLLEARGDPEKHLQMDIWEALEMRRWDAAILHPMCTYLTCSAAWAYNDPDYEKYPGVGYHQRIKPGTLTGEVRRIARMHAINDVQQLLDLPYPVQIENPAVSFLNKSIRGPDQVIHPYMFGDDASKATGFWGNGFLPPLVVPPKSGWVKPRMVDGKPRWANQTDSGQNRLSPSETRWLARSATYPGIAAAMGEQWGKLLK